MSSRVGEAGEVSNDQQEAHAGDDEKRENANGPASWFAQCRRREDREKVAAQDKIGDLIVAEGWRGWPYEFRAIESSARKQHPAAARQQTARTLSLDRRSRTAQPEVKISGKKVAASSKRVKKDGKAGAECAFGTPGCWKRTVKSGAFVTTNHRLMMEACKANRPEANTLAGSSLSMRAIAALKNMGREPALYGRIENASERHWS